ncbi:uncharacterized protein [Battus philenor]|uniref:uncharacterized protein n=1 Tax=Battus philenor TaxID=42288 RepID=UPI0035D03922
MVFKLKLCFCIDLKVACFIIGYFLLAVHVILTTVVVYATLSISEGILTSEPEQMKKLMDMMLLGQFAFPFCLSNLKFTIVLLVGLHKNLRVLIRLYLIYAAVTLVVTVVGCFVLEFMLHKELSASLSIAINTLHAFLIYIIRIQWLQLDPNVQKILKQRV